MPFNTKAKYFIDSDRQYIIEIDIIELAFEICIMK